jgi:HAD superfamily hydrolase (TIGR01509 family)
MKYIFDFDGVLFDASKTFRRHIFKVLEQAGVSQNLVEQYLENERWNCYSLNKMLKYFSVSENLYEEIMKIVPDLMNKELLKVIKEEGKNNCYLLSYGDKEYQTNKIKRAGVVNLFSKIIVVSGSKTEVIEELCALHKNENVVFVDDKKKHLDELDLAKCPNLKTILFTSTAQLRDALPDLFRHK